MVLFITGVIFSFLSFVAFSKKKNLFIYGFLFISCICIRISFTEQDPYLHNWDERYHALVAKNMMDTPLKPQLRKETPLPYNYQDWWGNHIWLHKQPLFLWQMALSLKIFGVNEFAVRFPSVILCALTTLLIYRIGSLLKKPFAGIAGALFFSFSFFSIEQTTGAIGMDHNDVAMVFYVTSSIWALLEYYASGKRRWIILIGIFSGMAILVKWLTGLLVYACWGLCILFFEKRSGYFKNFVLLFYSLIITTAIFLPWQIYIHHHFPLEAKYEAESTMQHLTSVVENHDGEWFYYLNYATQHYSIFIIPFILTGIFLLFKGHITKPNRSIIFSSILITYIFFSFVAVTTGVGYVFIVAPLILFLIGLNFDFLYRYLSTRVKPHYNYAIFIILVSTICALNLKYNKLQNFHLKGHSDYNWENRKAKIHNTEIYKSLDSYLGDHYLVFNANSMEEPEAMFYSNQTVYSWWPEEQTIDSLKSQGYKIAAFTTHGNQILPNFFKDDPDIIIIDKVLF